MLRGGSRWVLKDYDWNNPRWMEKMNKKGYWYHCCDPKDVILIGGVMAGIAAIFILFSYIIEKTHLFGILLLITMGSGFFYLYKRKIGEL